MVMFEDRATFFVGGTNDTHTTLYEWKQNVLRQKVDHRHIQHKGPRESNVRFLPDFPESEG